MLYNRNSKGQLQQWAIIVEEDGFYTQEGLVGGKNTTSRKTLVQPKNVGRANETTIQQQARLQANARYLKQRDKGWREDISLIGDKQTPFHPMLAHKYSEWEEGSRVWSQPKLDGVRCIATRSGQLFTRTGKLIVSCPHIEESVRLFFDRLPSQFTHIDGELYNHELKDDFNKLISLIKKQSMTEDQSIEVRDKIQYHIYDAYCIDYIFTQRQVFLQTVIDNERTYASLQLVPTTTITDKEELDKIYESYLLNGYEGQMIRSNTVYENKRSNSLLKRKEFSDGEYEIIDIIEGDGNRSGMMGRIHLRIDESQTFYSNARGTHQYFQQLLENKAEFIGKQATIRYQNLTPSGIPRFPVMIAIRDYES